MIAGDPRTIRTGLVLSVNSSARRVVVSIDGSSGSSMPYTGDAADYSAGMAVAVMRTPGTPGMNQWCIGSAGIPLDGDIPDVDEGPSTSVTVTRTISPTWSGTWRDDRSAWDRWNTSSYGGRSTLYQGDGHGSGDLTGLATYGQQIVALNATAITSMTLTLKGASLSEASYPTITVQGATNGYKPAGAPTTAGSTFNGSPGRSGTDTVTINSTVREAFRVGTYKGIALVGASYGAVRGTATAGAMTLTITYTKAA